MLNADFWELWCSFQHSRPKIFNCLLTTVVAHELAKLKPSDINHMSQPNKSPVQVTALQTAANESGRCPDLCVKLPPAKRWQICWDQNTWHSANVCHYGDWYSPSITLCSCLLFRSFIKLRRLPTVIRHQYEEMTKSTQGRVEVFQLWRAGEVKGVKAEGLLTFLWLKILRTELPLCGRTGADTVPTLSSGRGWCW